MLGWWPFLSRLPSGIAASSPRHKTFGGEKRETITQQQQQCSSPCVARETSRVIRSSAFLVEGGVRVTSSPHCPQSLGRTTATLRAYLGTGQSSTGKVCPLFPAPYPCNKPATQVLF